MEKNSFEKSVNNIYDVILRDPHRFIEGEMMRLFEEDNFLGKGPTEKNDFIQRTLKSLFPNDEKLWTDKKLLEISEEIFERKINIREQIKPDYPDEMPTEPKGKIVDEYEKDFPTTWRKKGNGLSLSHFIDEEEKKREFGDTE